MEACCEVEADLQDTLICEEQQFFFCVAFHSNPADHGVTFDDSMQERHDVLTGTGLLLVAQPAWNSNASRWVL